MYLWGVKRENMETITVALPKGLSLKNAKSVLQSLNFKIIDIFEDVPRLRRGENIPNETTKKALEEAEMLINDPNTKYFTSARELIDSLNNVRLSFRIVW
jgi:hypothetical protein